MQIQRLYPDKLVPTSMTKEEIRLAAVMQVPPRWSRYILWSLVLDAWLPRVG